MTQLNSDLIELLAAFERRGVRYLIVGGYAVSFHAEPRYTKDVDIWIDTTPKNAKAVFATLKEFGAPLFGATAKDFQDTDAFFKFGEPPNRIDILMGPPGLEFRDAWRNRIEDEVSGVNVIYVGRDDLIALKRAAGRSIDRRDVAALKASDPARQRKTKRKRKAVKKKR